MEAQSEGFEMIIADRREPETLSLKCDKVEELEWGDYLIFDENNDAHRRILVERKTTTDFLQSMYSERLHLQLEHVDILICEKTNVPFYIAQKAGGYANIQEYINTISIHTPVMQTEDQHHTLATLRKIEKRIKLGDYGKMRQPIMIRPKASSDAMRVLMGFHGIGEERALQLLKVYGSLRSVLANIDDWDSIKGFGEKKKADAIKALDEKW